MRCAIIAGCLYALAIASTGAAQEQSTTPATPPRARFLEPIFESADSPPPGSYAPSSKPPLPRAKFGEPVFYPPTHDAAAISAAPLAADPPLLNSLAPARSRRGCLDRIWVEADYLLWWMKGDRIPPLVTTSPAGTARNQAGVLGVPGTTTLFGDGHTNYELRSGGMITFGYWFDDCRTCGIEANFFMLESRNAGFNAASNGSTILARPFTDATTGKQSSELISFPGLVAGNVNVSDTSSGLLGAGA